MHAPWASVKMHAMAPQLIFMPPFVVTGRTQVPMLRCLAGKEVLNVGGPCNVVQRRMFESTTAY
jgi:hypothetical protein